MIAPSNILHTCQARSESWVREPQKSPNNKLIGIEYEDKAHYVVEEQDVMRSHYCRTDTRRLYMPERTTIADFYRELKRSLRDYCTFYKNTRNPTQAQMGKY